MEVLKRNILDYLMQDLSEVKLLSKSFDKVIALWKSV